MPLTPLDNVPTGTETSTVLNANIVTKGNTALNYLDGRINNSNVNIDSNTADIADMAPKVDGAINDTTYTVKTDKVVTTSITDGNVTEQKIANAAVTTGKLSTGAVTDVKIANDAVTTGKILNSAVIAGKLAADAVTTAKILDANVTDTKLAPNSVTTAKILDANVTAAKLANTVTGGILIDPRNEYTTPPNNERGQIWVNPAVLSRIDNDANNPYGGNSLRLAYDVSTTFAGKRRFLKDIHAKVGDTLRFVAHIRGTAGSGRIAMRFYDVTETNLTTQANGNTVTFNSTSQTTIVEDVVPTDAVSVRVYIARVSGTVPIDIHDMGGELITDRTQAAPDTNLKPIYDALTATASAFPISSYAYGRHFLRDTFGAISKILAGVSGAQLVVCAIGDSWINNRLITTPLTALLKTLYGDAGPGYVSANTDISVAPTGVGRGGVGTWNKRDNQDSPPGYGPDIASIYSTTVTDSRTFTATFTDARGLYRVQSGGGSFRWKVDSGSWTTVSTAGSSAVGTFDIPTQTLGSHTLTVEVLTAGSGVEILGADLKILGVNGVRIHNLGNGGATSGQYDSNTLFQQTIAALDGNLHIIELGTNDQAIGPGVVPATYGTNMASLITKIRAAEPLADVMLLSPTNNNSGGTYPVLDYVNVERALAVSASLAMIDIYQYMPSWADMVSRGLDGTVDVHLNAASGRGVAGLVFEFLRLP